jgi:LysM repeat protein
MAAAHNNAKKPTIPVPSAARPSRTVMSDAPVRTSPPATPVNPNPAAENTISMIFGAVVIGIILLLAVSFWRDWRRSSADNANATPTPTAEAQLVEVQELPSPESVVTEPDANGELVPVTLPARYTVKAGDSTWKIAQAFYGSGFNYVDIEAANGLTADSELTVGQQLTVPRVPVRQTAGGRPAGEYLLAPMATPSATPSAAKGDTTLEMEARKE